MRVYALLNIFLGMTFSLCWAQPNPPNGKSEDFTNTHLANIVGEVLDKNTLRPLLNAEVELLNFFPTRVVAVEDSTGRFALRDVPVGRYRVLVRALHYQDLVVENVIAEAGKEAVVNAMLEETTKDPVLPARTPKKEQYIRALPISSHNVLSYLGCIDYTLDEVNRFSGSRNDPSRLIAGASGVINSDDQRNDIIAFGANPLGMQYRLEGMPIINPNHLGYLSTPAGYLPVINTNSLGNSAFLQGNFSAEYGNATAGVLDMNLRAGNTDKPEFMAGFSLNGVELMAEGALNKSKTGSFMVNARYGILKLLGKMTFSDVGVETYPDNGDINFKIQFEKLGKQTLSIFGYLGLARFKIPLGHLIGANGSRNYMNSTRTLRGTFGLKHLLYLSKKSYIQTVLGSSQATEEVSHDIFPEFPQNPLSTRQYRENYYYIYNSNYYFSSVWNIKFSRFYTQKIGVALENQFNFLDEFFQSARLPRVQRYDVRNLSQIASFFYQGQYRPGFRFTLQGGLHALYYSLNHSFALEPRLSMNYDFNLRHRLSFGYALQHQQLPQRVYFYRNPTLDTTYSPQSNTPNASAYTYDETARHLPLWGNHYALLEYTARLSEFWQVKASGFGRYWFGVPIHADSVSAYSLYNNYSDLQDNLPYGKLIGKGNALNYGVDLSIKKSFSKGFYAEVSGAWFRVKYNSSDGLWHNSVFDRQFIGRLRMGQEIRMGRNGNIFFINTTFTWAGGQAYTPIDLQASLAAGQAVSQTTDINMHRSPDYIRWDLKLGCRFNTQRGTSHYFYIDAMNVLNRINRLYYVYAPDIQQIQQTNQVGFFPDIMYRFQF